MTPPSARLAAHGLATCERRVPLAEFHMPPPRRTARRWRTPSAARRELSRGPPTRAHRRLRRRLQQPAGARRLPRRRRRARGRRRSTAPATSAALGHLSRWPLPLAGTQRAGVDRAVRTGQLSRRSPPGATMHCGHTDPRDNHSPRGSYSTRRALLAGLKARMVRCRRGARAPSPAWPRSRAAAGARSPRRVNEFLFASTRRRRCSPRSAPRSAAASCTHTGLPWAARWWPTSASSAAPPTTATACALISAGESGVEVEIVRLAYDHFRWPPRCAPRTCRRVRGTIEVLVDRPRVPARRGSSGSEQPRSRRAT